MNANWSLSLLSDIVEEYVKENEIKTVCNNLQFLTQTASNNNISS